METPQFLGRVQSPANLLPEVAEIHGKPCAHPGADRLGYDGAVKRAILLVDHGSRRASANQTLVDVAALVREQVSEEWVVEIAHMEIAPPGVGQAIASCVAEGAREVVVHPYFLAPGKHATQDIARMVQEAARQHPEVTFSVTEPLGVHPLMAKLVLLRCGMIEDDSA